MRKPSGEVLCLFGRIWETAFQKNKQKERKKQRRGADTDMEIQTGVHRLTVNHKLSFPLCVDNGDYAPVSSRKWQKRHLWKDAFVLCPLNASFVLFSHVALVGIAFYGYQNFNQYCSWSSFMNIMSIQQEVLIKDCAITCIMSCMLLLDHSSLAWSVTGTHGVVER